MTYSPRTLDKSLSGACEALFSIPSGKSDVDEVAIQIECIRSGTSQVKCVAEKRMPTARKLRELRKFHLENTTREAIQALESSVIGQLTPRTGCIFKVTLMNQGTPIISLQKQIK